MKNIECEKTNDNTNRLIFFGIILFRVTLDYVYSTHISSIYGYDGFRSDFDLRRIVLSWGILILFIPMIIDLHKRLRFSNFIIIILAYFSFIPFTTMVAYYPFRISYICINTLYWAVMLGFNRYIPMITIPRLKHDKLADGVLYGFVLLFCATIIYISWRYTRFRITFDLLNVYDLRSEIKNVNLPATIDYIYAASKALNPVLLVYFLSRKKYKAASAIFIIQILSFSINGLKTVLFSTAIAVVFYLFYNDKYISKIPWFLFILTALSSLEIYVKDTFLLVAFIIRRVFFVPNLLGYNYFDFFSKNSPDYFRQSFLRHLGFSSPYPSINRMIGDIYYNKPNMAANNGLISDAYANLGTLGIFVMPLMLILFLKFLDACAEGIDKRIYVISSVTMAFILISSFLFPALLTHGFLVVCFIMYLLRRESRSSVQNTE